MDIYKTAKIEKKHNRNRNQRCHGQAEVLEKMKRRASATSVHDAVKVVMCRLVGFECGTHGLLAITAVTIEHALLDQGEFECPAAVVIVFQR